MKLPILIAMVLYMAMVIWIGVIYSKKTKTSEDYFLGGRGLGPWVTAMSAEASDMSSWLLMGLPGLAYATGFSQAGWTAIGLILGTYLNWKIVAKRLRHYTEVADNAITVPDFFSNRFKDDKKILSSISAIMILIFFTVYTASGTSESDSYNLLSTGNTIKKGDAIFETSTSYTGITSWNNGTGNKVLSYFPNTSYPFFLRGDHFNNTGTGMFAFYYYAGISYIGGSFRMILCS